MARDDAYIIRCPKCHQAEAGITFRWITGDGCLVGGCNECEQDVQLDILVLLAVSLERFDEEPEGGEPS